MASSLTMVYEQDAAIRVRVDAPEGRIQDARMAVEVGRGLTIFLTRKEAEKAASELQTALKAWDDMQKAPAVGTGA